MKQLGTYSSPINSASYFRQTVVLSHYQSCLSVIEGKIHCFGANLLALLASDFGSPRWTNVHVFQNMLTFCHVNWRQNPAVFSL